MDKAGALRDFATIFDIPLPNTCFFGDDVNDLSAMEIAGLCACPANAAVEVHSYVSQRGFVSSQPGGRGAVREFADAVLRPEAHTGPRDVFRLQSAGVAQITQ